MRRSLFGNLLLAAGLGFFAVIVLLPFWWVISSSIKQTNEIISITPTMVPHSLTFSHFDKLLRSSDFPLFLANSVIVTGASVKGTWVRIFKPAVEGRVVRGFEGLDVGDRTRVQLVGADVEKGFIDFARARGDS
jgi:hypothetical protein